jgi:hypothetical protein
LSAITTPIIKPRIIPARNITRLLDSVGILRLLLPVVILISWFSMMVDPDFSGFAILKYGLKKKGIALKQQRAFNEK